MRTRWLSAVLALTFCACKSERAPGELTARLLSMAEKAESLLSGQLPENRATFKELDRITDLAREALAGKEGEPAVQALNRLIFGELGFVREVSVDGLPFMLLPRVLASRRGSCLGLGGLYLALAERLKLPVRAVLVPGHLFVRHGHRSIELLRKGEEMPASWYRRKYRVPAGARAYLRPLSHDEVEAVFLFNLGNEHRTRGRLAEAREIYRRVVELFPDYPEAHANLGLVHHLSGEHAEAERAYARAAGLHPGLEGLDKNMRALQKVNRRD